MHVTLVASTRMHLEDAIDAAYDQTGKTWMPDPGYTSHIEKDDRDEHQASLLSEFAGRACYESFDRPNADTAKTRDYLRHIIDVQHGSVVEHGTVTFYVTGVSRSFTHELIRHRHLSYSQLSQRFTKMERDRRWPGDERPIVMPPLFEGNKAAENVIADAWRAAMDAYEMLVAIGESLTRDAGVDATTRRKRAREAARCVLPNMTPTAIVVTGNHRAWREFLSKRATEHADAEMCAVAVQLYDHLSLIERHLYQDFNVDTTADGRVYLKQAGVS